MNPLRHKPGYVSPDQLRGAFGVLSQIKLRTYQLMGIRPGHKVLDAGCGIGGDLLPLFRLVGEDGEVHGVDHDPEMFLIADKNPSFVYNQIHIRQADVMALPYPDGYFDSVRCDRVLQHVEDPSIALREFHRVLKKGGRLVISDTDWSSISVDCPERHLERAMRDFLAWEGVASGWFAKAAPRASYEAGFRGIDTEIVALHSRGHNPEPNSTMWEIEERAVRQGAVTREQMDRWRNYYSAGLSSTNIIITSAKKSAFV